MAPTSKKKPEDWSLCLGPAPHILSYLHHLTWPWALLSWHRDEPPVPGPAGEAGHPQQGAGGPEAFWRSSVGRPLPMGCRRSLSFREWMDHSPSWGQTHPLPLKPTNPLAHKTLFQGSGSRHPPISSPSASQRCTRGRQKQPGEQQRWPWARGSGS